MKSPEEIRYRIETLQRLPEDVNNYEISYLRLSLEKSEMYLRTLLNNYEMDVRKFKYEIVEDEAIIRALKWVLEEDSSQQKSKQQPETPRKEET